MEKASFPQSTCDLFVTLWRRLDVSMVTYWGTWQMFNSAWFSQEDHNILTPLTSLKIQVSIKVPLKCQQDPTCVPWAEGSTHGQGICPELVRKAVPHGERGEETPEGQGEPEHNTSSTYCLLIGKLISAQCVIDWTNEFIWLVQPTTADWFLLWFACSNHRELSLWLAVVHTLFPNPGLF